MIFVYKKWDSFCRRLHEKGIHSIPACDVTKDTERYIVLKHDVETTVERALQMAKIEAAYGHRGSYYIQAYLLDDPKNIELLKKMQAMGHDISYHYDVMDSQKGDLDRAIEEFEKNKQRFEEHGFLLQTLCQHGNPIVDRVGYTSNRDFFRSERVRALYPALSDIMVNFKQAKETDYTYYSDAGRKFKMIYDPLTNDIVNSDDKNIVYKNLDVLLPVLKGQSAIVSTHPHRWTASAFKYILKAAVFKGIKTAAKILVKIPILKKFMSRYYHLAKKI